MPCLIPCILCSHHINGTYPTCPEKTYLAPTCWWACDRNTTSKITYDQSQVRMRREEARERTEIRAEGRGTAFHPHDPVRSLFHSTR